RPPLPPHQNVPASARHITFAQAAHHPAKKIKGQHPPLAQGFLNHPAKDIDCPAVQKDMPKTAVHELIRQQLPHMASPQTSQAQSEITLKWKRGRNLRQQIVLKYKDQRVDDDQRDGRRPLRPCLRSSHVITVLKHIPQNSRRITKFQRAFSAPTPPRRIPGAAPFGVPPLGGRAASMRNFEREALAFSEAVANFARQKMLEITVALDVRTL